MLDDALRRGEVSYFSKLRAITRIATPANEESLLLTYARVMTAAQLEKTCTASSPPCKKLDDKATPADLAHDRYVSRQEPR